MDPFEHQGKALFAAAGTPVLPSQLARDGAAARRAIIFGSSGTAAGKAQALEAAGVPVARRPDAVPALVAEAPVQREAT